MSTNAPLLAVSGIDPAATLNRSENTTYREQLVEYALVSELLQDGWLRRGTAIEVLRADVDAAGYDVVLQCGDVVRHVQLKSTMKGGKTAKQKVHRALMRKPSGCVVWVQLEVSTGNGLRLAFRVLGGAPGSPLVGLDNYPAATHTKPNKQGVKTVRSSLRVVPRGAFKRLSSTASLSDWLFGLPPAPPALLPSGP